jgi:hypothetical protein
MKRMKYLAALVCLAGVLRADTVFLAFDGEGNLLRKGAVAVRPGGYAIVSREVLRGASAAVVKDDQDRIHPVLWIASDDPDAGLAEVWIGAQAPAGPDYAGDGVKRVRTDTHESQIAKSQESGGFGLIYKLDCGARHGLEEGPLYDEHGLLAGWHTTRVVDGGNSSFGLPASRFNLFARDLHLSLADWNRINPAEKEAPYRKGLAYLWSEDFDGALFYLRKAVEADSKNARAWFHLGFVEGKTGHGTRKIECYRKAIELAPEFADAHYYLGFGLLMAGDREGAESSLERLKSLKSPLAEKLEGFLKAVHVDELPRRRAQPKKLLPAQGRA